MRQTRVMSLVEATINVLVGFGIAVCIQIIIFPMFGVRASFAQNLQIGLVFMAASITRSYLLRRLFELLR